MVSDDSRQGSFRMQLTAALVGVFVGSALITFSAVTAGSGRFQSECRQLGPGSGAVSFTMGPGSGAWPTATESGPNSTSWTVGSCFNFAVKAHVSFNWTSDGPPVFYSVYGFAVTGQDGLASCPMPGPAFEFLYQANSTGGAASNLVLDGFPCFGYEFSEIPVSASTPPVVNTTVQWSN